MEMGVNMMGIGVEVVLLLLPAHDEGADEGGGGLSPLINGWDMRGGKG